MAKSKVEEKLEQVMSVLLKMNERLEKLEAAQAAFPDLDLVTKDPSRAGKAREDVYYVLVGVPKVGAGIQLQGVKCCLLLSKAKDPKHIPESEAMGLVRANAKYLETIQDPWKVFRYYRPTLIQEGFLLMKNTAMAASV